MSTEPTLSDYESLSKQVEYLHLHKKYLAEATANRIEAERFIAIEENAVADYEETVRALIAKLGLGEAK